MTGLLKILLRPLVPARLLLAGLLWLLAIQVAAAANPPEVTLDGTRDKIDIGVAVDFFAETALVDHSNLAQAPWRRFEGKSIRLRNQKTPVWFRFDIDVRERDGVDWLMEIPWPVLDIVELHVYDHTQQRWLDVHYAGNRSPHRTTAMAHRHVVFPLPLPHEGRVTVYLRAASASYFSLPITLWQRDAFIADDQSHLTLLGMLHGILFVMLLYNLSLFLFTRDKSYFFYSAYVFAILFFVLSVTGIGAQFLWTDNAWMRRYAFALSASFAYFTAALFVRQFLSLERYGGWMLWLNNAIAIYWMVACTAPIIDVQWMREFFLRLSDLVGAFSGVCGLVTTAAVWRRGNVSAKYFTIAWGLLIIANLLFSLMLAGVLERNVVTAYSQLFGFVLEVVLLSLVLAERINRERLAREQAQIEALVLSQQIQSERDAKLAAQAETLAAQQAANESLEQRVRERTAELEVAMASVQRFNDELHKLTITDSLTGVFNRHYFEKNFADVHRRAIRAQQPLSVLLIDVDHFKNINDNYGHLVGDECLKLVAHTLSHCIKRADDAVARYGGEEFVVLMPATRVEEAERIAEELRGAVESLAFVASGKQVSLTVSVGVAGWVPAVGERFEALLSRADDALYRAKREGRNRVQRAEIAG